MLMTIIRNARRRHTENDYGIIKTETRERTYVRIRNILCSANGSFVTPNVLRSTNAALYKLIYPNLLKRVDIERIKFLVTLK